MAYSHIVILFHQQPGMMALCGATLYDRVDITGHPLQEDFQSGEWVGLHSSFSCHQQLYSFTDGLNFSSRAHGFPLIHLLIGCS